MSSATITHNKTEMIFLINFLLFSNFFMHSMKDFEYLFSIENDASLTHREIKWIAYKITLNKTSKYTKYMNRIMRKFINNALKQIRSLFEKCFQKKIQLIQFKSAITIVLRKSNKKNYSNAKTYKLIATFNTLNKILKFIILKHICNVVEACDSILNV